MNALSKDEVSAWLKLHLKNWMYADVSIKRDFKFKNFIEAFSFMTAVALESEKMDHHPEWSNVYNKVSIILSTHQPKGITKNDLELAAKIDSIFEKLE